MSQKVFKCCIIRNSLALVLHKATNDSPPKCQLQLVSTVIVPTTDDISQVSMHLNVSMVIFMRNQSTSESEC